MQLSFHILEESGEFRVEERQVEISGTLKIGRLKSSDLQLEHATVSRMHAVIEVDEEGVQITDLGSSAGTVVNGGKIDKARLNHWDHVQLGEMRFYLQLGQQPPGRVQAPPTEGPKLPADPSLKALARRISATEVSEIARLPDGPAAVQGRAAGIELIASPVTGIQVVAYQLKVDMADGGSLAYSSRVNDFTVEDRTGRALVQVAGCKLVLERQYMLSSSDAGGVATHVLAELRRDGKPLPAEAGGTFTWEEYYLEPGEEVFVFGQASTQVQAAAYQNLQVQRLIGRPEDGAFIVSDLEPIELVDLLGG